MHIQNGLHQWVCSLATESLSRWICLFIVSNYFIFTSSFLKSFPSVNIIMWRKPNGIHIILLFWLLLGCFFVKGKKKIPNSGSRCRFTVESNYGNLFIPDWKEGIDRNELGRGNALVDRLLSSPSRTRASGSSGAGFPECAPLTRGRMWVLRGLGFFFGCLWGEWGTVSTLGSLLKVL